jgi:hypothetical protein
MIGSLLFLIRQGMGLRMNSRFAPRGVIRPYIRAGLFVLLRLSSRAAPRGPLMNRTARAYKIARGIYQREM